MSALLVARNVVQKHLGFARAHATDLVRGLTPEQHQQLIEIGTEAAGLAEESAGQIVAAINAVLRDGTEEARRVHEADCRAEQEAAKRRDAEAALEESRRFNEQLAADLAALRNHPSPLAGEGPGVRGQEPSSPATLADPAAGDVGILTAAPSGLERDPVVGPPEDPIR